MRLSIRAPGLRRRGGRALAAADVPRPRPRRCSASAGTPGRRPSPSGHRGRSRGRLAKSMSRRVRSRSAPCRLTMTGWESLNRSATSWAWLNEVGRHDERLGRRRRRDRPHDGARLRGRSRPSGSAGAARRSARRARPATGGVTLEVGRVRVAVAVRPLIAPVSLDRGRRPTGLRGGDRLVRSVVVVVVLVGAEPQVEHRLAPHGSHPILPSRHRQCREAGSDRRRVGEH